MARSALAPPAALRGAARYAGVGAAGLLFAGAVAALALALGPAGEVAGGRLPLARVWSQAPSGWREALRVPAGPLAASREVVRLSASPVQLAGRLAQPAEGAPPPVASGPLPPAPIAGLHAPGADGFLPIIATDGRTPFDAYRRPFAANGRPRIALVIGGLGLDARATQQAIETLPGPVTLAFSPYAEGLQGWVDMARAHGHEVLLEAPLEPLDYPDNDPGPYTLRAAAPATETVKKLEWVLSRATGYFGLSNALGSRFLAADAAYGPFAGALRGRGLAFIDDGAAAGRGGGLPRASAQRRIDARLSPAAIDRALGALETGATEHGRALGAGGAYPVTLEKVALWARDAEARGYQLAPASSMAERR